MTNPKNTMTKEDNEHLNVLLSKKADTKYFDKYSEYYFKITGIKNHSTCSKCSLKRIIKLLINYNNSIKQ